MQRAHLLISGRVQGVWYRASTRQQAEALGLVGWVRNLRDGRVEAVAEGPRGQLDRLVEWAREGPQEARVVEVAVTWDEASGEPQSFEVLPTA
ncbi:MAG: acylphosphatase [Deltaproteobacteria bacterium]|nr:acylphosphatase [Deltaproteobacteria bacterium]